MEPLSTLSNKALEDAVGCLKQQVTYLFSYKKHVENLDKKTKELHDAIVKVEHHVESEERKGKEIEDGVKHWLDDVKKIKEKCERKSTDHGNTSCTDGFFPNPWSRYTLGRKAFKMALEVDDQLQKKSELGEISWEGPLSREFPLSTADYKSFESRKETINKVKEKLEDSGVKLIGIIGPGGVGKTTLVKNIASQVRDKFKMVIMISVTKNPDRKKIQGVIADVLGLRLEEESEIGRANRIHERLMKEKENILIILDDLWDGLDLNGLGIPVVDSGFSCKTTNLNGLGIPVADSVFSRKMTMKGENTPNYVNNMMEEKEKSPIDQRMIKILLTSRCKDVLSNEMGVDENSIFRIGLLDDTEAETLFKNMSQVPEKSPQFETLVTEIVKKCERLPIAIITIGKALKGKSQHEWKDVVHQLERKGFTRMSDSLEFPTTLSFNSLENEELKSAFLLCAQMGNDPLTVDLMKYCYGLNVMQGVHTIKDAQYRTRSLIGKLKNWSLLMDSTSSDHFNMHDMVRDSDHFNMHDMVRDAALSISAKERHVLTMRDEKLDEWADKDDLERFSSISLCNCHINDDLPEDATFLKLKFFHINGGHPFIKIPNNFNGATRLKVLILTDIPLPHLPFSNESVRNGLRMLCLERCLLSDTDNLSIIGDLKKLRILSFSGSHIEKLPSELGKLSNLQWFDISDCSQFRVIPPNVLSRLDSLEELYMRDSPIEWGSEGQPNSEIQKATLVELSHLHQLTNLEVCISDASIFPRNLFLDVLDRYKIVIGDPNLVSKEDFTMPKKYETSRALVLQLKEDLDIHTHKGIKMLMRRVEKLLLGELPGIDNVFYELNLEGFQLLKHFCIQNNNYIECIIDSKMSYPLDPFPNLESLCLHNLKNLKTVCRINLTGSSFGKLKSIKIKDCRQLENIFPISMVRLLKMLETFEVSNCCSLKNIVVGEENTDINGEVDCMIELPKLRSLTLQGLPAFTSFYANGVITCPYVIFNIQVEIPKLETLELSSINNQIQKIWNDQTPRSSCLKNLVKLKVDGCNGLTYLFSFLDAKDLKILKTISVHNCDEMDKIIMQEEIKTDEEVCIFPKLEEINLTGMKNLREIWHSEGVRVKPFLTLSSVIINGCQKLVTVFPHHMVGLFPHLEKLEIYSCESVIEIFELKDALQNNGARNETNLRFVDIWNLPELKHVWNRDPKGILIFKKLQKIEVDRCNNLENLFPPFFAKSLENLDYLSVINCPKLHDLIAWDKGAETSGISHEFPRLTFLEFSYLPKLEIIHRGVRHTLEWPLLKKLVVDNCDKLEVIPIPTFKSFLPEKVISNLEYLKLSQKEAERLHHYVDSHLLHRLKELHFDSLQSNAILYKILHRIPNLERLSLRGCRLKELLPSGSLVAHEKIGTVIQIKELRLEGMDILNIGFEHDPVLQRVERLFLSWCYDLKSLAPSRVSFTHLISLEVSYCNKLLNLMGSSTAESLVKLTTMKVTGCNAMTEIVGKERNEEDRVDQREIVFRKLMTLELVSLENLTSFCNCKNHNLNFPVLEKLIVRECPKMKIFSASPATAPILRQVSHAYAKDEGMWLCERDVNAALMVFLKYKESLELSQYPELERVWHGQESLGDNPFRNLKKLAVTNCGFLSSVIPSHLLAYLKNLKELEVSNCNLVEVIFDINDTKTNFGLKTLSLEDLPKLKHVWNKDPQGLISFGSLQDVSVYGCKRLETLFPKSVAKNLLELKMLCITNCGAIEEIVGKEDAAADGAIDEIFGFPRLATLRLSKLPELKCFYWGRFNLKCPVLEDLYVNQCGMFGIFKSESQSYEKAASEDQIIPIVAQSLFSVQEDPELERVWHGQVFLPDDSLCNLKKLAVSDCGFLSSVIPSHLLAYLKNLEELKVSNCNLVEVIFDMNDTKMTKTGEEAFCLKTLSLSDLPNLKHVWNKDPQGLVSFRSLQDVSVDGCKRLETLFPKSVAKNLLQLEKLHITNCGAFEEIVGKEDAAADGATDEMFEFPRLAKLRLSELPELKCFYCGRFNLKCPVLEDLDVNHCGKLEIFKSESESYEKAASDEIIPTEAQSLFSVQEDPELERVWHGQVFLPNDCFCNLKTLKVTNCNFLSSLIPFHLLAYLSNLEELRLSNCNLVEVIFDMNDTKMTKTREETFRLKTLSLDDLPNLKHVWSKDPKGLVSFGSLQDVSVDDCKRLRTLFPKSVAKNLLKLGRLHITNCRELEEIVVKEDAAADGAIDEMFELPRLTELRLSELPELKCFINLKCPMLEDLYVNFCGEMEIFKSESQSYKKEASEDQIIPIEAQSLFAVQEDPELERVWHGQVFLSNDCFCNLKTLMVTNCDVLSSVIPSHLLAYLSNLEELRLSNCNLVEVIFDMNDTKMTKTGEEAFRLKKLSLSDLPNLKQVWSKDPKGLINFGSLQDVSVYGCKRLETLFPKSVAKNLLKLELVDIKNCRALGEIVGKEEAAADGAIDEMFDFPCLAKLVLFVLPELKCFYWGRFNLKCPLLEELCVIQCGKLEIFKSESQSSAKAASEDQIIRIEAQSLFSVQKVIFVTLNERDIKMLWRGGFQESLHNLKWLVLQGFHNVNETDHLPFEILQKVPNLDTLVLDCCDFKEISFSGIFEDYHVTMPAPFKRLELWRLHRLNSIGSKHSFIDSVLENLEVLQLRICHCLTKVIQSSVPFFRLKELHIDRCDGLVHLFTSSTVKSLVRLEEIHVERCDSITEIVAEDTDDSDSANEILFEQLKVFDLNTLPSLRSFHSGSSTLKFPYLNVVKIIKCPRMNTFSNGITEVPMLGIVHVSEKNSLEVHDLKSTVEKLFNEKISFAYMEVLKLSNYPELEPLWLGKVPLQENCFSNLKTLMVENCEFLSIVIPSNLLPSLKSLEELQVRNCTSVEVIFEINEIKTSETEQKGFLLKKLTLDQLPNLKLVWNKHPQRIMSIQKLQKVKVSDCKSLQYLFPAASMAKHLLKLKVQNCEALEEVLGKEEVSETFEFHYLTKVILNHLPELNCFYPGRLNLKFPKLKVLSVYHCGKLEMFTSETRSNQAILDDQVGVSVNGPPIFTVEEVPPKLEEVSLNEKETMTLWHEEYQANFLHNIKCLQLYCFHSVTDQKDTLPYGFLHKVPNLEILAVACSDFKMIFPSRELEDEYIGVLSKLKGLRLEALPKLSSIGLEHSWLAILGRNLETLEIRICSSLTNIVQSAVSFSNLRELTVIECHGLVHLFTSSTAKSLGQLRKMSIGKCKSMREIVAKEEKESSEDEIVFGELTKLSLNNLPYLESFHAGDSTLRFPYLQEVIITQCSKMKVFSEGFICAPQLPSIRVSLEKSWDVRWEGDLNSTVKKLFKGKEVIVNP